MDQIENILLSGEHVDMGALRDYLAARETVNVKGQGAIGDGAANDTTPIGDAIVAADGKCLIWPAGTYNINAQIAATFTGDHHWVAQGPVRIVWTGSAVAAMLDLTTEGFDFTMEGPFELDGDDVARECLHIEDVSDGGGEIRLYGVKARNAYSVLVGTGSDGIVFKGGFRYVRTEACGAYDISRDAGVGDPAIEGSIGIGCIQSGSFYTRQWEVIDCEIGGVTSEEADGDPENVDCDGLLYTGPSGASFGNEHPPTVVIVRGGRFYDNRGRHIKSQAGSTRVSGASFARSVEKSIASGCDIDFQYGQGLALGNDFYYNETGASGTPFGASFSTISASVSTDTTVAGAVIVANNTVHNNYPLVSGDMPYFVALAAGAGATFRSLQLDSNQLMGSGRVGSLLRAAGSGNFAGAQIALNDNYCARLSSHFANFAMSIATARVHASGNVSAEGTLRALVHSDVAGGTPFVSGSGNVGFTKSNVGSLSGLTEGAEVMRADAYGDPENRDGGMMCLGSLVLADDATGVFRVRNYAGGIGTYIISTDHSRLSCGMFAHDGTGLLLTAGSTNLEMGDASNPDVDTKLNVWMDSGTKAINVRNRLGSSRVITLWSLG